jgi:MFS family permease
LKTVSAAAPARHSRAAYYALEAFNSVGSNVFFLGIFFHARVEHGFSDTANLMLAVVEGIAYAAATRPGGRFADRRGHDLALLIGLAGMCLSLVGAWLAGRPWALYAAIGAYSAASALTWPALEAAIARAPGTAPLARRAGLYNVVWAAAGAVGFFISGPLFALDADAVFWTPLAAHVLQTAYLAARWRPRRQARTASSPDRPGEARRRLDLSGGAAPAARPKASLAPTALRRYLRSAWIANGLGYFLFGAFAALAPALGERLGLDPRHGIWFVSSYLFARTAVFVLFWAWGGWTYRTVWVVAALVLQPAALAALFAASSVATALLALATLGALSGVAYSASLHASLDREGHEGEGGGLHEWVIGIGVLAGPLAGAAGVQLGGPTGAGIVAAVAGTVTAALGLAALRRTGDDI